MQKIHRFDISKRITELLLPKDLDILYLGLKGNKESVWIMLDPEDKILSPITFKLVRTDEEIPEGLTYLGSLKTSSEDGSEDIHDYDFMYHVFYKQG